MVEPKKRLCLQCRTRTLVSDLAELPPSCKGRQSRYFVRCYDIYLGDLLVSAGSDCAWCKMILKDVSFHLDVDEADLHQTVIGVGKAYSCPTFPHEIHFDRLNLHIWVGKSSVNWVSNLPHEYRGRLHFGSLPPDVVVADKSCLIDSMAHQALQWMHDCSTRHENCIQKKTTTLPTRLIDVNPDNAKDAVRLYTTESGELGVYTALSYCWGGPDNLLTTRSNIMSHSRGIATKNLPLTISEAVTMTRLLGIRFLWVDALCIVQDSKADKKKEIRNMRNIFKNSHVTLVAAHAASVHSGFLYSEQRPGSLLIEMHQVDEPGLMHSTFLELHKRFEKEQQPVNARAWTLEERVLSSQLLVFTSYGLVWECEERVLTFDAVIPQPGLLGRRIPANDDWDPDSVSGGRATGGSHHSVPAAVALWMFLVEEYSTRALTKFSDKLPAIAGIAEEFARRWQDRLGAYHAGVWTTYMVEGLSWESSPDSVPESPPAYRAPSWSWASRDAPITYARQGIASGMNMYYRIAEVLNVKTRLVEGAGQFGGVQFGKLTIRGLVARAECDESDLFYTNPAVSETGRVTEHQLERLDKVVLDRKDASGSVPIAVTALMLWRSATDAMGLVLISSRANEFKRIGSFHCQSFDSFKSASEQSDTLSAFRSLAKAETLDVV